MKSYAQSDWKKNMEVRKTLHQLRIGDLDMEWIQHHQSEKMLLPGPILIAQAKVIHEELTSYNTIGVQRRLVEQI